MAVDGRRWVVTLYGNFRSHVSGPARLGPGPSGCHWLRVTFDPKAPETDVVAERWDPF